MNLVIINGSQRTGRNSIHVSRYLESSLEEKDVRVRLLDIGEFRFPVMEERMRFLDELPPRMQEFSDVLLQADGIILVTPEYNGSYSGALKNTLDYFKSEYEWKPMGLVSVSTGKLGGVNALHHLQAWAIHVKGIVCPYKLQVDHVDQRFNNQGELSDPGFSKTAGAFLDRMLELTNAISQRQSR